MLMPMSQVADQTYQELTDLMTTFTNLSFQKYKTHNYGVAFYEMVLKQLITGISTKEEVIQYLNLKIEALQAND